jgi:hypothetical protein
MKLNDVTSIHELYFEAKKNGKDYFPGIPSPLYFYQFDDGGCVIFGSDFSRQIETSKRLQKHFDKKLADYLDVMRNCFKYSRSFYFTA